MQIGVVFPQTEIGGDAGAVRAYASGVEELGYAHLLAYDHVLGADPAVHAGWDGPYDVDTTFHEPFVLFGYLAAITSLELVTGIIILPQRQTALVAKQAAEVDLLTGGRFRLGVGLGWNAVEYEALGEDFANRGARGRASRSALLRRLWTERTVTYAGSYERVTGAGLAPAAGAAADPDLVRRPRRPRPYRRAGRLADGWFPQVPPGPRAGRGAGRGRAGRDRGRPRPGRDSAWRVGSAGSERGAERSPSTSARWRDAGATHVSVNTMGAGLASVDGHLAALSEVAAVLGLTGTILIEEGGPAAPRGCRRAGCSPSPPRRVAGRGARRSAAPCRCRPRRRSRRPCRPASACTPSRPASR